MKKRFCALIFLCFYLAGCKAAAPEKPAITCADAAKQIEQSAGFQTLDAMTEKYIAKYLMIDMSVLNDYVMLADATRATPEMILLLQAKEEKDIPALQQAMNDFLQEQLTIYRDYQPLEMPKLESAKVTVLGTVLALIVSPDANITDAELQRRY